MKTLSALLGLGGVELIKAPYRKLRLWGRSIVYLLDQPKTCLVRGHSIKLSISSTLEDFRARTYSVKEPETLDWLDANLRDDDVFMDVGANIGLYCLYAASLNSRCKIYAFEPESQNFSRLCRNIVLNKIMNIVPCNFPLADEEAFDMFYVGEMHAGSALHSFGEANGFRRNSGPEILRQGAISFSLDTLVQKYCLPCPTLLKIDVDGIEKDILNGARDILTSGRVRSILVEVNVAASDDNNRTEIEQMLNLLGYRLCKTGESAWQQHGLKSQNYIFSRP